jgi:exodeoxyribonuclease VII large subunit
METLSNLFSSRPIWTVGDLTLYIRQMLESDYRLQDMWVTGEVSNVSRPSSGHLYFTLRDENASLRCVMWRPRVAHQTHFPRDGEMLDVPAANINFTPKACGRPVRVPVLLNF